MNFTILLHAVESVFTLCLIAALGYFLAARGWFHKESKVLLPRLVTVVALPAYMLYNITHSLDRDNLLHLAYGLVVPVGSMLIVFTISLILARALRVTPVRHGPFCVTFTASNTIFLGLPINLALFGEVALPYVLLYYFANTVFFWTVGNYMIAASGVGLAGTTTAGPAAANQATVRPVTKKHVLSLSTLKQIISPALLGFLLALLLVCLGVTLPDFVTDTARYVGSLTTPLILISLGVTFQSMRLSSIRLDRDLTLVLLGRFVVSPLAVVLMAHFIPLPDLMRKVFIIQASLPVIASAAVLAGYYKSDEEFTTMTVLLSTLLAVLTVPLYMVLLSN